MLTFSKTSTNILNLERKYSHFGCIIYRIKFFLPYYLKYSHYSKKNKNKTEIPLMESRNVVTSLI